MIGIVFVVDIVKRLTEMPNGDSRRVIIGPIKKGKRCKWLIK